MNPVSICLIYSNDLPSILKFTSTSLPLIVYVTIQLKTVTVHDTNELETSKL